jgi:hypothetical protein
MPLIRITIVLNKEKIWGSRTRMALKLMDVSVVSGYVKRVWYTYDGAGIPPTVV